MAKFNEGFNPQGKILIPYCMPYEELNNRHFLIIFAEQETLATSSLG